MLPVQPAKERAMNIPFQCRISPSETFAVLLARHLFPEHEMDYGDSWSPGYVYGVTEEEFRLANELLAPEGAQLIKEGA
jgi:hypothetical protein